MKTEYERLTVNQRNVVCAMFAGYTLNFHSFVGPFLTKEGEVSINVHRRSFTGLGKIAEKVFDSLKISVENDRFYKDMIKRMAK